MIHNHIRWAQFLADEIEQSPDFELLAPVPLATICFRYKPPDIDGNEELNHLNQRLLGDLNQSGELFLTHTKLAGRYTIRFVVGQTYVEEHHVKKAWQLIRQRARSLEYQS